VEATAAIIGLIGLALTALLLVWDLAHPSRFLLAIIKPQFRSMLVWGAYFITAYTGLLGLFLIALWMDSGPLIQVLRWIGIFLAVGAGGYTALLFGQAKGRDLWQEPALPLHLMAQITLAGSASLLLVIQAIDIAPTTASILRWVFLGSAGLHLLLALSQIVMPHPTADGARAGWNLVWGRYRPFFWTGVVVGTVIPLVLLSVFSTPGPISSIGAALALVGLAAYEHAYVQAGQSVPLS
jgi:formate-dependent nitrite reductase membrane component NrfD